MRILRVLLVLAGTAACTAAVADQTPSPAGAMVPLQLLFANFTHTPFVPNVASNKITITVTQ